MFKFIDWFMSLFGFEKYTSIFRLAKRPTMRVRAEMKGNETWLVTYIVCDYCKWECKACTYFEVEKKWKCERCENNK